MKYYKVGDLLYQFNPETGVYKLRNSVERVDKRISKEDLFSNSPVEIKKTEFSRLMNIYFKDVKHSWVFEHTNYRKLDNFLSTDSPWVNKLPNHGIEGKYPGNLFLVYHWGKVYYFSWSYNGYPQGILCDLKTKEMVRWAKPKHCAPIFNEGTKKIM